MLSEEEIRNLIIHRVFAAANSCSSYHINHVEGQIKALLVVLTGKSPEDIDSSNCIAILQTAGVPVVAKDGGWAIDTEWLEARGFDCGNGGMDVSISHPEIVGW